MGRNSTVLAAVCLMLHVGSSLAAPPVVFYDDFAGVGTGTTAMPDRTLWYINHEVRPPLPDAPYWWTQGRSFFANPNTQPNGPLPHVEAVSNGRDDRVVVIEHHQYNPYDNPDPPAPKWTFIGGEINTRMLFTPDRAYRFQARVRSPAYPDGLVSSIFPYHDEWPTNDEIDYEFVSKKTNAADPDPVLANPWNEGSEKPQYIAAAGLDLSEWNTFNIYWHPDQWDGNPVTPFIKWAWVSNPESPAVERVLLRNETDAAHLPDEPMSAYFNFWAPLSAWTDAYSADLQPAQTPGGDVVYRYEIDFLEVRELFPGDANVDGVVDVSDLSLLAGSFRQSPKVWEDGNFNGDLVVDVSDLAILAGNFRKTLPARPAAVPEPGVVVLLIAGAGALVRRKRRNGRHSAFGVRGNGR